MITAHPEGMQVCLDAGYIGAQNLVEGMGYVAPIRGRGEEREEQEHNLRYKTRRWVEEVCHSWMNRFRKLPELYKKKVGNYQGPVEFA